MSSPRSSGTSGLCSRLLFAHSLCSFLLYWLVAVPFLLIEADACIRLNAFYQPKIRMLYFTTSFL
jgi:hypothetical protein